MARTITTEIEIAAAPARVWQVLTDFERYADWNPFMVAADGTAQVGDRLTLSLRAMGRTFTVRPTVVEVADGRVLRWLGRLGVPGLFDGEHSHIVEPTATGARYVQQERFRGALVPFVGKTLAATEAAFGDMNEALKQRAEQMGDGHVAAP